MFPKTRGAWAVSIASAILGCVAADAWPQGTQEAEGYGTFAKDSPGVFPDASGMKRPYVVRFASRFDGAEDYFTIAFPKDFDPNKTYSLWFKFCPFYGSRSALKRPTLAWNYCDANQVILIGCNERGVGESFLGDNRQLLDEAFLKEKKYKDLKPENIPKDVLELMNEMCHLFKINYIGATGASMGGYSSLRLMTHLPREYVGVVISSCPAIYFRPYVKEGSDRITEAVKKGHFNDAFVKILHGTADDTVSVKVSKDLTAAVPEKSGWELVEIQDGKHTDFFCSFGTAANKKLYPHDEDWGKSDVVPDLWGQIHRWEKAHPKLAERRLAPLAEWQPGTSWYLPEAIVEAGRKMSATHPASAASSRPTTDRRP